MYRKQTCTEGQANRPGLLGFKIGQSFHRGTLALLFVAMQARGIEGFTDASDWHFDCIK
jgi:hypothetical protein